MRKRDIGANMEKQIIINFEGKRIVAYEGETVAEALFANGVDFFMLSGRKFRPRGLFCADGGCGQCRMNIDGDKNALACRTVVHEGMKIKRNLPKIGLNNLMEKSFFRNMPFLVYFLKNILIPVPERRIHKNMTEYATDVLIIGTGTAGKSAINTLKKYSKKGMVVTDEQFNQDSPGITVLQNTRVFSIDGNIVNGISYNDRVKIIANKIVIATGSRNRDRMFINNDLPGILTYSAAKKLINRGIRPGNSAVIYGSSGSEEGIAEMLESAGIEVVGLVTDNLYRSKFNIYYGYEIKRALGYRRIRAVDIFKGRIQRRLKCDVLILTDRTKDVDLVLNAGGKVEYLNDRRSPFPVRDRNLQVARNIYYAGNFSEAKSAEEGEKAIVHALNLKRRAEMVIEMEGAKNEDSMQITGYHR